MSNNPMAIKKIEPQKVIETGTEPVEIDDGTEVVEVESGTVAVADGEAGSGDEGPVDVDNSREYESFNKLKQLGAVPPKKEVDIGDPSTTAGAGSTVEVKDKLGRMKAVPVSFEEGYWLGYEEGSAENYAEAKRLSDLVETRIGGEYEAKGLHFDHAYVDPETGKLNVLVWEHNEDDRARRYVVATDLDPKDLSSPVSANLDKKLVSNNRTYERPERMAATLDGATQIDEAAAKEEIGRFGATLSDAAREELEARYGMEFQGASRRVIPEINEGLLVTYMKDSKGIVHQIDLGWVGDGSSSSEVSSSKYLGADKPMADSGYQKGLEKFVATPMKAVPVSFEEGYRVVAATLDGATQIDEAVAREEVEGFGVTLSDAAKEELEARYGMEFQGASMRVIPETKEGLLIAYMKAGDGTIYRIELGWKGKDLQNSFKHIS